MLAQLVLLQLGEALLDLPLLRVVRLEGLGAAGLGLQLLLEARDLGL